MALWCSSPREVLDRRLARRHTGPAVPLDATQPVSAATAVPKEARHAGRGVLSIAGAKLYFIVTGYAVQLLLPRFLGTPEAFGLFSTAMNVVSILNNVLI